MSNVQKSLAVYMKNPDVIQKFADVLGDKNSMPYIQSVLIAVSASQDLMKCSNESIFRSALRAASLGLSCDPALKQAWIVPYNKKVKTPQGDTWVKEAQFQPHYKGLYTLAMRTGKYWQINVAPIYDGQRVMENPLTGLHAVAENNALGIPDSYNRAYSMDVTVRRAKDRKVIGWLGYFKTKKGFEKSVYMSVMEIDDHARKYVKDYDKNPNWNDADKRPVMEMKTVLRQLLSWADLSGSENLQLVEALADDTQSEIIDTPAFEDESEQQKELHEMTADEAGDTLYKTPIGEIAMGLMDSDALNKVYLDDNATDVQKRAAAILLKEVFNFDPPEKPKAKTEKNMKELGF